VCFSVIYNYDGHSEYDLQLAVGDTVQIKEHFNGNAINSWSNITVWSNITIVAINSFIK